MTPEKIQKARDAGYTDAEIAEHLSSKDAKFQKAFQEGYSLDEISAHLSAKEAAKKKPKKEEPSVGQVVTGLGAEIAIAEGAKAASTAGGAAIGTAIFPGPGSAIGAGVGYVTGAIGGGVSGSIAAQKIEGRDKISWGRVAVDTALNLIPGNKLTKGPKALKAASRVMAKSPVVTGVVVGGVAGPAGIIAEQYEETGEMPDFQTLLKSGVVASTLGGGLGATSKVGEKLFRRFAGKNASEIDRLLKQGDRGAIAYVDALTANVDPAEFMTAGNVKQYISELSDLTKATIAPSKLIGEKSTQAIRDAANIVTAGREVGGFLGKRVNDAIANSPNPQQAFDLSLEYLTGKIPSLPPGMENLAGDLSFARKSIYEYQQKLLDNHYSGQRVLPEHTLAAVEQSMNDGDYLTRSYRFFEDAEYQPTKKQQDAVARRLEADGMPEEEVNAYLARLNTIRAGNVDDAYDFFFRSQNAGVLKERKDLSPELREYLGENLTPGEKIAGTMSRLSRLTAYDESDAIISRTLLESGLLKTDKEPGSRGLVEIKLRRGNARTVVNGEEKILYGSPDVQYAVNQLYGFNADNKSLDIAESVFGDAWDTAVGLSKAAKVLGNPPSYLVQLYGNLHNIIGMGMNPGKGLVKGVKMGVAQFADSPIGRIPGIRKLASQIDLPTLQQFKEAKELGLVPQGLQFADIQAGLKGKKIGTTAGKLVDPLGKIYSAPDIAFRITAFENNLSLLRKSAIGADEAKLKKIAAQFTNDTYQNYDYINKSLRTLSRKGIPLSQFAAFSIELMRNQYNQGRLIKKMADGSLADELTLELGVPINTRALKVEAAKRAASLATLYASYVYAMNEFNRRTVSEEQEAALRETVLEDWNERRPLTIQKKGDKISTMNTSYIVPHMQMAAPFLAGVRGESIQDAFIEGTKAFGEDILGEGSFAMQSLTQALQNHSFKTGAPISYDPNTLGKVVDISRFFVKDLMEPGVLREYEKAKTQKMGVTAARQAGIRINQTTIADGFRFKGNRVSQSMNGLSENLAYQRSRLQRGQINQEQFNTEFQKINEDYIKIGNQLVRHVNNLRILGQSEDKIIEMLNNSRIGTEKILAALDGEVINLDPAKPPSIADQYEKYAGLKDSQVSKELIQLSKTNAPLARQLGDYHRQVRRDEMLEISPKMKLVRRLPAPERARYIFKQMQKSQDPDGVLKQYQRKGALNAETYSAIKLLQKNAPKSY